MTARADNSKPTKRRVSTPESVAIFLAALEHPLLAWLDKDRASVKFRDLPAIEASQAARSLP